MFLPCTASEITTTTTTPTPTLIPPPAAALLLLPLRLVLVLLGCCFVCTPWPANKDCGPVVVVTGGGSQQQREKTKKTKIYKFRDKMSNQVASLTKQDKSLYVTRGSSLCLYQQQQQHKCHMLNKHQATSLWEADLRALSSRWGILDAVKTCGLEIIGN